MDSILNKVTTITKKKGAFSVTTSFTLNDNEYKLRNTIFDTGCTHSMISSNILYSNSKQAKKLKLYNIYNMDVYIAIGFGVESQSDKVIQSTNILNKHIRNINTFKLKRENDKLKKYLSNKQIVQSLLNEPRVKFSHIVNNYTIGGIQLNNIRLQISYDFDNINLAGMQIISQLDSQILSRLGETYLLIAKPSPTSIDDLKNEVEEISTIINFMDQI